MGKHKYKEQNTSNKLKTGPKPGEKLIKAEKIKGSG